jgi:hypothetical protein
MIPKIQNSPNHFVLVLTALITFCETCFPLRLNFDLLFKHFLVPWCSQTVLLPMRLLISTESFAIGILAIRYFLPTLSQHTLPKSSVGPSCSVIGRRETFTEIKRCHRQLHL